MIPSAMIDDLIDEAVVGNMKIPATDAAGNYRL